MVQLVYAEILDKCNSNQIHLSNNEELPLEKCETISRKFLQVLLNNFTLRFGDSFKVMVDLLSIFSKKDEIPNFQNLAQFFALPEKDLKEEWNFIKKMPRDFSTQENQIFLATAPEFVLPFPNFFKNGEKYAAFPSRNRRC